MNYLEEIFNSILNARKAKQTDTVPTADTRAQLLGASDFVFALRKNAPPVLAGNMQAQLRLFEQINSDGSGCITREQFSEALQTCEDPMFLAWVIHQAHAK